MHFSAVVEFLVLMCSAMSAVAVPANSYQTMDVRAAKIEENAKKSFMVSSPLQVSASSESRLIIQHVQSEMNFEDTWLDADFLEYLRDVMALFCPTKKDDIRTCESNESFMNNATKSITSLWKARRNFVDAGVKCGQLVITDDTKGAPSNVACVLYIYDNEHKNAQPSLPPRVS